ncbi:MAG: hypothetical protein OEW32_16870, partial [Nitrospira sp.]|nr:hypothetical protein [Nitrospira sp.]
IVGFSRTTQFSRVRISHRSRALAGSLSSVSVSAVGRVNRTRGMLHALGGHILKLDIVGLPTLIIL